MVLSVNPAFEASEMEDYQYGCDKRGESIADWERHPDSVELEVSWKQEEQGNEENDLSGEGKEN